MKVRCIANQIVEKGFFKDRTFIYNLQINKTYEVMAIPIVEKGFAYSENIHFLVFNEYGKWNICPPSLFEPVNKYEI